MYGRLEQIHYNYLKALDDKDCNYVRLFAMNFLKAFHNVKHSLNSICQWACFKKKTVIIVGDLNLDRLRLDRSEGKILRDLEEVNDLHCLINEPTRVTANSQTLIDVMLTNNLDLFENCGVYNPEISDHSMIYGEMTEKVRKHTTKTLVHRQTKTTDFDNFNKDLLDAPWHVGEIFDDLDDAYDYWRNLFDSIANEHAPMRKKRVRERDVCFMSKEWKAAIRNKRKYACHSICRRPHTRKL